jgi:hypothetical protein
VIRKLAFVSETIAKAAREQDELAPKACVEADQIEETS